MQCNRAQLVSLVEKAEVIYDLSIRDESTYVMIDTKWDQIAEELKCSVFECKSKWANLRSAYCRYLRDSGKTPRGRRRKKWYMAEKMKFLKKHIVLPSMPEVTPNNQNCLTNRKSLRQSRPSTSRAPDSSTTSMTVTEECSSKCPTKEPKNTNFSYEIKMEDSMELPPAFDSPTLNLTNVDENDDNDYSPDYNHSTKSPDSKKQKNSFVTFTAVEPSKSPNMTKIEYTNMEDNPDTMFFKSILADYKDLSKKRKRYFRELMVTTMNKLQEEDEDDTQ